MYFVISIQANNIVIPYFASEKEHTQNGIEREKNLKCKKEQKAEES